MIPVLYISIPSYILFAFIGICVALAFIYIIWKKMGWKNSELLEYAAICAVFAVVISRIVFVISFIPSMDQVTINGLLNYLFNGGIVFYGGLFGVLLGIVVVSKKKKTNTKEVLDLVAPAFPLFHSIARIGCLMAGCCYGVEWSWGVILADDPEIVRFPVQLMESLCNILIFTALITLQHKQNSYKNSLKIYLCCYAVCRFVLEFYRGDTVRGIWKSGLSTSQYISLVLLGWCIFDMLKIRFKNKAVLMKKRM